MARRDTGLRVVYALTREQPKDWMGHRGRIDKALLAEDLLPAAQNPTIYVCGPTALSRTSPAFWWNLGSILFNIKTERFGPSGG